MIRKPIKIEENNLADGQMVHTPMGTTIQPAKFFPGDTVITSQKISEDNVAIPENVELTVMSVNGDDMYSLVGPNGLIVTLNGSYLEKA